MVGKSVVGYVGPFLGVRTSGIKNEGRCNQQFSIKTLSVYRNTIKVLSVHLFDK